MGPFTYGYYKHMLEASLSKGFVISSFKNYDSSNLKTIILRHDVDYTLDGVLHAAKIEKGLGCTATYLFRLHSEYNLFNCVNWNVVQQLVDMGHEIGLHFEAMNVGRALNINPVMLIKKQKDILESMLGEKVLTASEHRDISGQIHNTPLFHDKYDPYQSGGFSFYAMDPKYCKEMKYLSDSNAHWREGDLLEHIDSFNRFQVLIHLDWWFEKDLLLKGPYYHPTSTAS